MTFQVMPPLCEADYAALKADIAERGIMVPIEVDEEGAILDGHHRAKICDELDIHCPRFVREGMDEAAKRTHARRLNIARRHLNSKQKRALIAVELRDDAGRSNRQIGAAVGVSDNTVRVVRDELESTAQIAQFTTTTGADGKSRPARKPIRYILIDETPQGMKALKGRMKEVRADEQAVKRAARDAHLISLSNSNAPLPQDRRYSVLYADPPWQYDFSPSSGRAVENHYPTMPIEEIWALDVAALATEDAILFLWAPPSFIKKGTLEDRAIVVPLRRRRDGEAVERFRADRLSQFAPLLSKAVRWAADNIRAIADRDPAMPEGLDDRAHDNWRILIAIADQAGGHWPKTARAAAAALSSAAARGDDSLSRGVLLLRDIREVMADRESMSSTALIEALIDMDEAPWKEWRAGKPITANGIARILKPYKVGPHRGRTGSSYRATDLQDPWSRYLDQPADDGQPATCHQSATKKANDINDVLQVAAGCSPEGGAARTQDATGAPEFSGNIRGAI